MKAYTKLIIGFLVFIFSSLFGLESVKLYSVKGEVKVRSGLEETFHPASTGMVLRPIDTILTLEGEAVIILDDGIRFHLGSNTLLDIGDLREITKREIFLFLMSEKVNQLPHKSGDSKLQIGNVSVVHGASKKTRELSGDSAQVKNWIRVLNGAKTLYRHGFYTNTVMKIHKSFEAYSQLGSNGETYFYLGKSFEKLNEPGHAIDAYQTALGKIDSLEVPYWAAPARDSIQRLKASQ